MNPALLINFTDDIEYKPNRLNMFTMTYVVPHQMREYAEGLRQLVAMQNILRPGAKTITLMHDLVVEHVEMISNINIEGPSSANESANYTVTVEIHQRVPMSVITAITR